MSPGDGRRLRFLCVSEPKKQHRNPKADLSACWRLTLSTNAALCGASSAKHRGGHASLDCGRPCFHNLGLHDAITNTENVHQEACCCCWERNTQPIQPDREYLFWNRTALPLKCVSLHLCRNTNFKQRPNPIWLPGLLLLLEFFWRCQTVGCQGRQKSFSYHHILVRAHTRTKPCETSPQHVFKGRLKQTEPDAPIICASESLTHRTGKVHLITAELYLIPRM